MRNRQSLRILLGTLCLVLCTTATADGYVSHNSYPFHGPMSLRDESSAITVYVESDGIHVSAISDKGKVLWTKNLEQDGLYSWPDDDKGGGRQRPAPKVVSLRVPNEAVRKYASSKGIAHALGLTFNTTVFGFLNLDDGSFYLLGQD